jgi:hypothetical protein
MENAMGNEVSDSLELIEQDMRECATGKSPIYFADHIRALRPAPEAAPVDGTPVAWWNGQRPTTDSICIPSISWGGENDWHDIPLYAGMNPCNFQPQSPHAAIVHNADTPGHFAIITPALPAGTKLYTHPAAPVDGMVVVPRELSNAGIGVVLDYINAHIGTIAPTELWALLLDKIAAAPTREEAPFAQGEQGAHVDAVSWALNLSRDWIENAPHGDDCFVSDHYEGDPGNRCNCGKDGALQLLDDADEAMRIQQLAAPSPAEPRARTCSDERMCINCFADQGECLGPYKQASPAEPVAVSELPELPSQFMFDQDDVHAYGLKCYAAALTAAKAAQPESVEGET